MAQRILVTGANGFVGRQLCLELDRAGYAVRAAVRDASRAVELPGETAVVGTIDRETDWASAVSGVDAVIHLAARVHVMKETAVDPEAAFRDINVFATEALARASAHHGVKRLVFASSIKVNGECTGKTPFTAADPPAPQDAYAVSKWEAEQSLWRIADDTGLEVVVIRPPLVYGPGVGGNFLRLLKLTARGIPLPLASVKNRRSMIYNGNLGAALLLCATHPAAAGRTYLVSDGEDLSTPQLITRLANMMDRSARLWPIPAWLLSFAGSAIGAAGELDRLIGSLEIDSSMIRRELDWTPAYVVNQGLAETARWFVDQERRRRRKPSAGAMPY